MRLLSTGTAALMLFTASAASAGIIEVTKESLTLESQFTVGALNVSFGESYQGTALASRSVGQDYRFIIREETTNNDAGEEDFNEVIDGVVPAGDVNLAQGFSNRAQYRYGATPELYIEVNSELTRFFFSGTNFEAVRDSIDALFGWDLLLQFRVSDGPIDYIVDGFGFLNGSRASAQSVRNLTTRSNESLTGTFLPGNLYEVRMRGFDSVVGTGSTTFLQTLSTNGLERLDVPAPMPLFLLAACLLGLSSRRRYLAIRATTTTPY